MIRARTTLWPLCGVLAMLILSPGTASARGGGHGGGGGSGSGSGLGSGHTSGGKVHESTKGSGAQPGAMRESGDSKGSGETKPVNASAKPDTDTAATTRPPGRKKR